jgi:hypothetical protein
MKKRKKDTKIEFDVQEIMSRRPNTVSVVKQPKHNIPPLSTLPLKSQMELVHELPSGVIHKLKAYKPTSRLRDIGIPNKILHTPYTIEDFTLVSSYMIAKQDNNFLELFIDTSQQAYWMMLMVFKPNHPYLAVISAEGNSSIGLTFAAYLANYYSKISITDQSNVSVRWYRSLEFVPYKKEHNEQGVVVIQCRWPSWVDNREKLLRTLFNVRASFDNAIVILLISQEDLEVVPTLLAEEPFGVFFKLSPHVSPKTEGRAKGPTIKKVMNRLKKLSKES